MRNSRAKRRGQGEIRELLLAGDQAIPVSIDTSMSIDDSLHPNGDITDRIDDYLRTRAASFRLE
jgi:hypothetical protein